MKTKDIVEIEVQNQENYDNLLVSIEASDRKLSLLIAVCDDSNLRDQIIARYEAELAPEIRPYRVTLARGEPSLRSAISQLVEKDEYLKNCGRAVLTVTGVEQFYFLKLGAERSEQEIFFGYLQWTREGLREFPYPIVLWVTNQILVSLSKKAPDFWSWRKGVFRFESKKTNAVLSTEAHSFHQFLNGDESLKHDQADPYFLPLEDLQQLIQQIEQERGVKDPSLATLYARMGEIYKRRVEQGEALDYKQEQDLGIEYFRKAADLQTGLGLEADLSNSLDNLASLYWLQGRYTEAEPLLLQALEIDRRVLPDDHPELAKHFNNLANLYLLQGRYTEAEPLYLQALEIARRTLPDDHPDVATRLNNLAGLYESQGRYSEAEPLLLQALEIHRYALPDDHRQLAGHLNNLASLYRSQGRYSEAEPLFLQAVEIDRRALPDDHRQLAGHLNNLANLYRSQGRYSEAEPLYLQALEIVRHALPDDHLDLAISLDNLASLYRSQGRYSEAEPLFLQAVEIDRRALPDDHRQLAGHLNKLANLYRSQGRYSEAEPLYMEALEISDRALGSNHPQTIAIRDNLGILHNELSDRLNK